VAAPGSSPGGGSTAVPSDPQGLYDAAYGDYVRGNYDLAIRQFQEYLRSFPDTEFSDNAAYWIGECYYRQNAFQRAITEFDRVLDRYPESDKVPSALLKKGYAYLELGERSQGVVQLQYVIREYPTSDEASLARQRLREIGVDPGG
jgi:tol-pal system protein YbgF